jgi:hypothetical protein
MSTILPALEPFGAFAVLAGFAAALMPRRSHILGLSALCSVLFCAHFLRAGSSTGAAMCAISALQSLAGLSIGRAARARWIHGFFAASSAGAVALTLATWAGPPSAFAGIGTLLATAGRLQTDAQRVRLLFLASGLLWAGHNILVGSAFGLACDVLTIGSMAFALWRYRRPAPEPGLKAALNGIR